MAKSATKRLQELDRKMSARSGGSALPDPDDEIRVSWLNFILFTTIALALFVSGAVFFGTRGVQGSLEAAATEALKANEYRDIEVIATGVDLVIAGNITPEQSEEEAAAIVMSLSGVGYVETQLWVVEPTEIEEVIITGEPVTVTWIGSRATASGEFSTQENADFFVTQLEAATDGSETERPLFLSVDSAGIAVKQGMADETPWIGGAVALVQQFAPNLPIGEVFVNPAIRLVQVSGEVETRRESSQLNDAAEDAALTMSFQYTRGISAKEEPLPTKQQVEQLQTDLDSLIEGKVVEFDTGSAALTPVGTDLLDEILVALTTVPNVPVQIAGHTDGNGGADANLDLSQRRAQAAFDYLVGRGASSDRFEVIGYGETQPIAANTTSEGRAKNRRIEFIALEE